MNLLRQTFRFFGAFVFTFAAAAFASSVNLPVKGPASISRASKVRVPSCSPLCVSPQFCVGNACTNPQLSLATASGVGMTGECTGGALTTVLGGAITFTRSTPAYCTIGDQKTGLTNSSMVLLTTNQPRATTGGSGPTGLLMELQGINVALASEDFTDATTWMPLSDGVAAPTVTGDAAVAPNNTTTAERVVFPATTVAGSNYTVLAQSLNAGNPGSGSIRIKGNGMSGTLDLSNTGDCEACAYNSTTWTECTLENSDFTSAFSIGNNSLCGSDRPINDVFIWGGQAETGTIATSYIPTTTVAVTRAADVATTPYTAAGGTISMSATVMFPSHFTTVGNSALVLFFNSNNRLRLNQSTASAGTTQKLNAVFTAASTTYTAVGTTSFAGGSTVDVAGYYDGTNVAICTGGVCDKSAASITLPTGAGLVYPGNSSTGTTFAIQGIVKNVCVDPTHCPSFGQ